MKGIHDFSHFLSHRISLSLALLAVLLMGVGQPVSAGIYDTYRSWSYYSNENGTTKDDHFWSAESLWQGNSSVEYSTGNYAKSLVGFGSDGSLVAKIGVSVTDQSIYEVYSNSNYRDDGFQCAGTTCGTAVPLGGSFEMQLKQEGSFTLGTANFGLGYYLRTQSTAYSFDFAVQQGEMDLEPYGWFSKENLSTGARTITYIVTGQDVSGAFIFNPLFNMVWGKNGGVYNFSYDFSFDAYSTGEDLGEELSISANAYGGEEPQLPQFVDSYNSFHATVTPAAGAEFYRGGQLVGSNGPHNSVPEPATMLLLGLGLTGIAGVRRKLKK